MAPSIRPERTDDPLGLFTQPGRAAIAPAPPDEDDPLGLFAQSDDPLNLFPRRQRMLPSVTSVEFPRAEPIELPSVPVASRDRVAEGTEHMLSRGTVPPSPNQTPMALAAITRGTSPSAPRSPLLPTPAAQSPTSDERRQLAHDRPLPADAVPLPEETQLVERLHEDLKPSEESYRPTSKLGRAAFAAGSMATHPIETAETLVAAPVLAATTLGKYSAQQLDRWSGRAPDPLSEPVTRRDAAFAAGQLLTLGAAGPTMEALDAVFGPVMARAAANAIARGKSPAQALMLGYSARVASRTAIGAAGGATFSPQDPELGAILGAALAGLHAATQMPYVRIPRPDVVTPEAAAERALPARTPARGTAHVVDEAPMAPGPDYTVEDVPRPRPIEMVDRQTAVKDWADESIARAQPPPVPTAVAPAPSIAQTAADVEAAPAGARVVERPAGSGTGAAVVDAAAGSRTEGVRASEGETPGAPRAESQPEEAPATVAPPKPAVAVTARDDVGRLKRNLRDVPSEAIADEIVALGDAIGADVPAYRTNTKEAPTGDYFRGHTLAGAKALGRSQQRMKAMQRLTAEIERRGENPDDHIEAAMERQAMRAEAEGNDRHPIGATEEEVAPGVSFSPAKRTGNPGPDLFGERPVADASDPLSLFGEKEGTAAARNLETKESAARSELDRLNVIAAKTTDAAVRGRTQRRIAELERLVNRGGKIAPHELSTRAAAERDQLGASEDDDAPGPDQGALFSPAAQPTSTGAIVRRAIGLVGRSAERAQQQVKSLAEITKALGSMAGVPLRQGRFNAKKHRALGVFFPHSEVARVIRHDMIETGAHEVGHYVSKKYLRNPTMRKAVERGAPKLTGQMKRELVKMGKDLYGDRKPNGGYGEEGIAQWARFYVANPAQLAIDAPAFSKWMEETVLAKEPGLKAALDQGRADLKAYREAPATARVDAMIDTKPAAWAMPDPRRLATLLLDDLAEVRKAVEDLAKLAESSTSAAPLGPERHAYVLARLTRGDAGVAEEMIERGIVDPTTGKRLTRGVQEILGELKKEDLQPLRRYLIAERALEFGKRGISSGISTADANDVVKLYEGKYRKVAEELWGVSQALIDYRVAKHNLTPDEGKLIKSKNQRRVGFYRVFDEETSGQPTGSGRGFFRNSSGLQKAKGSARTIVDPLESLLTDVYKTVRQAHQSDVIATLVKHAEHTPGGGRVIEVLTEVPQQRVVIPVAKVRGQLAELGFVPEGQEAGETSSREISGVLVSFMDKTQAGGAETKDLVRPVVIDGERKWIQINDRHLYDALQQLGSQQLPQWARFFGAPTRLLRAGATLTGEFITRNPVRDAVTAAVYSRAGFKPPGYDFVSGLFHVLRADDTFQRWRLEGGDNAAMLGLDRQAVRKHLEDVLRSKTARATGWVLHPIDTLRLLSSMFENATRVGEFAAVEREALKHGATPKSAAVEGAIAARDVTIDFAQAGEITRAVNQLVAFLNANVRGWAKLLRELKERPAEVLPRLLALITIPSILLWWLQRDDEDYQNVPTWQKAVSWVIVQRDHDGKLQHIWRIPKPPDLGVLFGTVPERIAEWLYRDDPKAFQKFAESLSGLNPIHFPNAIAPIIEWWANKNLFTDRPIVPEGAKDLPAGEQSTSRTGEFARVAGDATNLSPAKLENTVRGYAGGLGQYFLDGANRLTRVARDEVGLPALPSPAKKEGTKLEELPVMRGFMVRTPQLDAQPVQDLLDTFSEAEARRQAWRKRLANGDRRGADAYFKQHETQIRSVASATDGLHGIGNVRRAHEVITDAQKLSIDADDATRQRVADVAIAAAKAALDGEAVKRADLRALTREIAQRKRSARSRLRDTMTTEP